MKAFLEQMQQRLMNRENLVLVTVIASSGATPRGAGARMLVGAQGRICGTIGGGAVEYRSEQIAARVLEEKSSRGHDFTLTRSDVEDLGMICGGACSVFFCYLSAENLEQRKVVAKALELIGRDQPLWLISDLADGGRLGLYTPREGWFGLQVAEGLREHLSRHPQRVQQDGRDFYTEQIHTSGKVYVFGGGHVAQELVPVLSHVGFPCVVMDDRAEFLTKEHFPTAEKLILGDFSRISDYIRLTGEDYVCVMTRGHASDTVVQAQVLPCHPCYVGVIGSRQKAAGVRRKLQEEYGLADAELDQVITPIGLDIKSETPAEIAISIAAQMILHRAERNA